MGKFFQEKRRVSELYGGRNSSYPPVVDSLDPAPLEVVTQQLCDLGWTPKALDELPVSVDGGRFRVHGLIKHDV